jgi:hypothetical protein
VSTGQQLKVGALVFAVVPGCGAAGHFFGGLIAFMLGEDEELWMRRGEIFAGCFGFAGFIGAAIAILT